MKILFFMILSANIWPYCDNEVKIRTAIMEIGKLAESGQHKEALSFANEVERVCKEQGLPDNAPLHTTFLTIKISALLPLEQIKKAEEIEQNFYNSLETYPIFTNQDDLPSLINLSQLPELWSRSGAHKQEIESRRFYLRILAHNIENIHKFVREQINSISENPLDDREFTEMREKILEEVTPYMLTPILRQVCSQRLALTMAILRNNDGVEVAEAEIPGDTENCFAPSQNHLNALFAIAKKKPAAEIRKHLEKSARAGSAVAQRDLAFLYLRESNNPNRFMAAYVWLKLLEQQFQGGVVLPIPGLYNVDQKKCKELLLRVEQKLSSKQKIQVEERIPELYTEVQAEIARIAEVNDEPRRIMVEKRRLSNYKACMSNQKTIMAALEMYELDSGERLQINHKSDMQILVQKQYLSRLPNEPGNPEADTYRFDSCGNVYCLEHGSIGDCVPCENSGCEEANENARNKDWHK